VSDESSGGRWRELFDDLLAYESTDWEQDVLLPWVAGNPRAV